jgi:hypothetical protein
MPKNKQPVYGYTIRDDVDRTLADQSGDKFDEKALSRGKAVEVTTPNLDRKAMRYLGTDEDNPDFDVTQAGAGRGGQGGPTAKELKAYEDKKDAGIFTKEKRMPPSPREMASGGTASSRADGIAQRGKTRGTIIK